MTSYTHLLAITLPVFALFALGVAVRRAQWLTEAAETSLLKLIVNLLYPCLILKSVLGNAALRDPASLMVAPLLGFGTILVGMAVGYYAGRVLGLSVGHGLRTFAFAVGIYNYAYIPIPLVQSLWGTEHVGVLLVYSVGIELALWTVGLLLLAGLPPIRFLGHTVSKLTAALHAAQAWWPFRVRLCPALSGTQLLNDGGFYTLELDPTAKLPAQYTFHPLPRNKSAATG